MIYPLLRPVQPVFNSAAAIRNTLTLGFDGDVKEAWKPLSVKRPRCLHTLAHMTHTHTHHRNTDTLTYSAPHSLRLLSKPFHSTSNAFFLFSQTASHCFFLDTTTQKEPSCMITHLNSALSRLCFQHVLY